MTPPMFILPLSLLWPERTSMEEKPELARLQPLPAFTVDPLESAIANAASSLEGVEGLGRLILEAHLKELCALQLQKLK
ncbi:hypothetical protein D3C77_546970 [compost metagenome]